MSRVAVVTDSAADLPPGLASGAGVTVVPLLVTFGEREYRAGIDMTPEEFWRRLTEPGAPFPRTAACAPGAFRDAFEHLFAAGAESVVCVTVGAKLSATLESARLARAALPERDIRLVDSASASMGQGMLALLAAELASAGATADAVIAELERRRHDGRLYVALDTLEYLRRGGRISAAQAAIGAALSIKPIITVEDGVVATADRVRTRRAARARLIELLTARPIERLVVIHGAAPEVGEFAAELADRAGLDESAVPRALIGPAVGAHLGPGVYGAVVLYRRGPEDR